MKQSGISAKTPLRFILAFQRIAIGDRNHGFCNWSGARRRLRIDSLPKPH
ncbi:hypothetical protein [Desulfonema magnum]|uniref:Uncharacterized protein n=1 Tax=Desulfonema magnum TaxID=45655 RepID=A0A975BY52_9BACT|nr:hypothetical protein [Desulfonema magnum]QTA93295.1 Uncharacterized protein dnm_093960 [Desulfonema magnum]